LVKFEIAESTTLGKKLYKNKTAINLPQNLYPNLERKVEFKKHCYIAMLKGPR